MYRDLADDDILTDVARLGHLQSTHLGLTTGNRLEFPGVALSFAKSLLCSSHVRVRAF
jgi:hypothetical protein